MSPFQSPSGTPPLGAEANYSFYNTPGPTFFPASLPQTQTSTHPTDTNPFSTYSLETYPTPSLAYASHSTPHMSPLVGYEHPPLPNSDPNPPSTSDSHSQSRHSPYPQPQAPRSHGGITERSSDDLSFSFVTRRTHTKKALTAHDKKNICLYAERFPQMRQEDIAGIFSVERSTVSKILKDSAMWLSAPHFPNNTRSYKPRKAKFPGLEELMIPWLEDCKTNGIPITDNAIKDKANQLNHDGTVAGSEFKASGGWLENFKRRQGIKGGQYRGTQNVVLSNGHIQEIPVEPLKESVHGTNEALLHYPWDLRRATVDHPAPLPDFWEQEADDLGLDTTADSDDGMPPGDYSSPSTVGSHHFSPHINPSLPRSSVSPSPSSHSSHPLSTSDQGDINLQDTSSLLEPPRAAPEPINTPWITAAASHQAVENALFHAPGEKPYQGPLIHDVSGIHPVAYALSEPDPFVGGGRTTRPAMSTLEAKEALANLCHYLDVHGRSRKLCKRSQRVAFQEVFGNIVTYMHSRELSGLEPN